MNKERRRKLRKPTQILTVRWPGWRRSVTHFVCAGVSIVDWEGTFKSRRMKRPFTLYRNARILLFLSTLFDRAAH